MEKTVEDGGKNDSKYTKKKDDGITLDQALELLGFGRYNYMLIAITGANVLGNFAPMMIFSYVVPATDCDLNLTVNEKGLLSSVIFTGMILTTHLFGCLADEYGRKYVATICNLISGLLTFVTAFTPSFWALTVITFINGAVNAGVLMPTYVYVGESTAVKHRPVSVLLCGAMGYTATMFLPILAIITIPWTFSYDMGFVKFTSWRLLLLLASLTPILASGLFLFLPESPKYLLAKGKTDEMLAALQFIYRLNNRGSSSDFPIKGPICLGPNEIEAESGNASFKRVWAQTKLLFKKPLKRITIMACLLQAGLNGACNLMFVRLAQLAAEIRVYARDHVDYDVTMCEVLQGDIESNSTSFEGPGVTSVGPCNVSVPAETYYISAGVGLTQVSFFIISGPLTRLIGSKSLLVIYVFSSAVFCIAMITNNSQWATLLFMMLMSITLETSLPMSTSILMDYFPTSVRSSASCMSLAFGRIATTAGTMTMAALQTGYCDFSYWGLSIVLICLGILAQMGIKGVSKTHD